MHITRKGKERVIDNNHITVEYVDNTKGKESDSQRTSTFNRTRLSVSTCLSIWKTKHKGDKKRATNQCLTLTDKPLKGKLHLLEKTIDPTEFRGL